MDSMTRAGKQALAHARDYRNGGPYKTKIPSPLEIKSIRKELRMTQLRFSQTFAIDLDTVKSWEIGRKKPSQSSSILLALIQRDPKGMATSINSILSQQSLEDHSNSNVAEREYEVN